MAVATAAHEACHVAAARLLGVRTRLGVGRIGPCPVICIRLLDPLEVSDLLKLALTPLILVTAAFIFTAVAIAPLNGWAAGVMLAVSSINVASSAGDLAIYLILRSAPPSATAVDKEDYIEVMAAGWRPKALAALKHSTAAVYALLISLAATALTAVLSGGELSLYVAGQRLVLA